jgi:hypothetical protein
VFPTRVSVDGSPSFKVAGVTIDWTVVAAVNADTTLADGSIIRSGQKFLRYGQVLTMITASKMYGPFDSAKTDGTQTLTRGECFILDETVLQYSSGSPMIGAVNDQVGGLIDGGPVWLDRILQSGVGTHSLAAGPTLAELIAAFPSIKIVRDE